MQNIISTIAAPMKIICIENNYSLSNNEEQPALSIEKQACFPAIYSKADSSILINGKPFFLPDFTSKCTYAAMLVVRINRLGRSISKRFAHRYYNEVTLGIDFTAQDLLEHLIQTQNSWELSKSFDGAAPLGRFITLTGEKNISNLSFRLDIDGKTVQEANSQSMLHSVDTMIAHISQYYTLKQGDLLFTGTPSGKGIAAIGQHYEGYIEGERVLNFYIR